jgi:polar amino acid transport system substrate-binding protein
MKKIVSITLILLLAAAMVGCSNETAEEAEMTTWERIQDENKIVIGLDDTFPPMGYREEGTNDLIGFDIDMGAEMANRMGVEFEWLPTEWKGVTGSLNAKKFDAIINGMSITDERLEVIDVSIPYISAGIGAVVTLDSEIDSLEGLETLKVGTQTGSSGAEACLELGYENITYYDQYPNAFQDLSIGRVDVVVVDATTAAHFIDTKPGEYRLLEGRIVNDDYAIGLRMEDDQLEAEFNRVLREMMEDGTMGEISMKWFGDDLIAYEN